MNRASEVPPLVDNSRHAQRFFYRTDSKLTHAGRVKSLAGMVNINSQKFILTINGII